MFNILSNLQRNFYYLLEFWLVLTFTDHNALFGASTGFNLRKHLLRSSNLSNPSTPKILISVYSKFSGASGKQRGFAWRRYRQDAPFLKSMNKNGISIVMS